MSNEGNASHHRLVYRLWAAHAGRGALAVALLVAAGCSRSPELDFINGYDAIKASDFVQAIEHFEQYLEKEPHGEHADAVLFYKAFCHVQLGQTEQALGTISRLVTSFPRSPYYTKALHQKAAIHLAEGKRDQAIETYDLIRRTALDVRLGAEAMNAIVHLYVQEGQVAEAVAYVKGVTDPTYTPVKKQMDIGSIWEQAGRYEEAEACYDEIASSTWVTPSDQTVGWMAKAVLYADELDDGTRAIELLRELRRRFPDQELSQWSLVEEARVLRRLGAAEAEGVAEAAIAAYAADVADATQPEIKAWYGKRIGEAYVRWGELEQALETYRRLGTEYNAYTHIWQEADARAEQVRRMIEARDSLKEAEDAGAASDRPAGDVDSSAVGALPPG